METADDEEEEEGVKILLFDLFDVQSFSYCARVFSHMSYGRVLSWCHPKCSFSMFPEIHVMWHFKRRFLRMTSQSLANVLFCGG